MFGLLFLDNILEEGQDYIGFSDTLTLMPGVNSSNSTTVTILDDQVLEMYKEVFEIQMKLAPQSPFKTVSLMSTPRNITILDNEGKLYRVTWIITFVIFLNSFLSMKANTVPEIGFKAVSHNISEGEVFFTFDVKVKNNVSFVNPVEYALEDNGGEALSKFP